MAVSYEARPVPAKAMAVSIPHRHKRAKATAVSDSQAAWPTEYGCGAHGQRRHHRHPHFARNLSRSFFKTPQKRCNSNDANSMFKQAAGELGAKLMGGGRTWPNNKPTRQATHQHTRPHWCGGRRKVRRARASCETRGELRRPWAAAGPGQALKQRVQPDNSDPAPLVWRAPEGPEGTGGLRGAAPNEVRSPSLAGGRALRRPEHPWGHKQQHAARTAGRRPWAHQAARPSVAAQSQLSQRSRWRRRGRRRR